MTLHWWMHWFWVTSNLAAAILAAPTTHEPQIRATDSKLNTGTTRFESIGIDPEDPSYSPAESPRGEKLRIAKAIGVYPNSHTASLDVPREPPHLSVTTGEKNERPIANTTDVNNIGSSDNDSSVSNRDSTDTSFYSKSSNGTTSSNLKKDGKVTWILTSNETSGMKFADNETDDDSENLAVLPLREEAPRFKLVLNRTKSKHSGNLSPMPFDRSGDVEAAVATAASIRQAGISGESTRLSRARSAFPSDFQLEQQQQKQYQPEAGSNGNTTSTAVDIAAVTGSCLATVVLLSTMGSLGFIMYRRRYLNPPQTLNSDKCSNPDSSGYIDDSTIRDNSEEMYSLDNDSFLNSLEAMTIQNYWTDSVKHTKL